VLVTVRGASPGASTSAGFKTGARLGERLAAASDTVDEKAPPGSTVRV